MSSFAARSAGLRDHQGYGTTERSAKRGVSTTLPISGAWIPRDCLREMSLSTQINPRFFLYAVVVVDNAYRPVTGAQWIPQVHAIRSRSSRAAHGGYEWVKYPAAPTGGRLAQRAGVPTTRVRRPDLWQRQ
jgi:hypothetical protein